MCQLKDQPHENFISNDLLKFGFLSTNFVRERKFIQLTLENSKKISKQQHFAQLNIQNPITYNNVYRINQQD